MDPCLPVVRALAALTGRPGADDLARALASLEDVDAVLDHTAFAHDRYVRVPLHGGDGYELRLLCWLPGQSSAMHAHGPSACAFRVLRGEATETLLDGAVRVHRPGEVATAADDAVHQVGNLGKTPLVTLHAYAPALPVDQPSAADGRRIVILGGGWCGAALAIHLLGADDPRLRITLVDGGPAVGRGVAYGTPDPDHLLNVPANQMSLDPDDPDDFFAWARARAPGATPSALLPRRLYGDYVLDRLRDAVVTSRARLRVHRGVAADVERGTTGWRVHLDGGHVLDADEVVLATGHGPAARPGPWAGVTDPRIVDPWSPGALDLPAGARIAVLGTGLTAMDVLATARRRGAASALAVSRHGRWPRPHLPEVTWRGPAPRLDRDAPADADGLAAWLDAQVRRAGARGVPWQAVLAAVRDRAAALWQALPVPEQARFLAVHRGAWEVIRHRAPAEAARARRTWQAEGWLRVARGVVADVHPDDAGLRLTVATADGPQTEEVDRLFLCAGNETALARRGPLWARLTARGLVHPDVHGLGVRSDGDGRTVDGDGSPTGLWAVGGLVRARTFEATAVPDLAPQVQRLARRLTDRPALIRAIAPVAATGATEYP